MKLALLVFATALYRYLVLMPVISSNASCRRVDIAVPIGQFEPVEHGFALRAALKCHRSENKYAFDSAFRCSSRFARNAQDHSRDDDMQTDCTPSCQIEYFRAIVASS
jgi:hypothetical protein